MLDVSESCYVFTIEASLTMKDVFHNVRCVSQREACSTKWGALHNVNFLQYQTFHMT